MHHINHTFHIPVMGTGHSIDSPIRVAHLGIDSVISVVDDLLCEKIRKYYSELYDIPFKSIPRSAEDGRALRITAYLNTVNEIVQNKFEEIKSMSFFSESDKDRYFNLLPSSSIMKQAYEYLAGLGNNESFAEKANELTGMMTAGSIDVNIMSKVDALRSNNNNGSKPLDAIFSDASAALRGFANSTLQSSLVLSAGFNPRLYSYLSEFKDFYRDQSGMIKKKIILKVSDFRSALIQGKFLAKKGLEIAEFRIESGLNCGGHAFASDGYLLPVLLKEFREKRDQLVETFQPMIKSYYESMGWEDRLDEETVANPKITVQGGIGTHGELRRLMDDYQLDATGWGSPFLLVPEATCVDKETEKLLANSDETDLYLSDVSPLGVPFNNIRGSGSEIFRKQKIESGKPGSKCPKQFLVTNTEFTDEPICTASAQYQLLKISQIEESEQSDDVKESQKEKVMEKSCLCSNLGSGALIRLGLVKQNYGRQEICPGPNIAWFNRSYTLEEMVDHIYGRGECLVPNERPHMFAKELVMYVDYLETLMDGVSPEQSEFGKLKRIKKNIEDGMEECLRISDLTPNQDENLKSIKSTVEIQKLRLEDMFSVMA